MSEIKPIARKNDIVVQEFDGELLIYDLKTNRAFALNVTSSKVWQHCNGKNTISDIAEKLSVEMNDLVSRDLILLTLDKLSKESLISEINDFVNPFDKKSRREIIRQIGMTSLVALPVIASLVAPKSAHAASCAAANNVAMLNFNGCTCTGATACQNNCCGTDGATNTCVSPGLDGVGSACRASCECASVCCGTGNACATLGGLALNAACVINCECSTNMCTGSPMMCT